MEEQFVPYELASKLKDLGLNSSNEYCFGFYTEEYKKLVKGYNRLPIDLPTNPFEAPLWQQAFDWFREKHKLYVIIIPTINMYWTFKTMTVIEGMVEVPPYDHVDANDYSTYEEARKACLEKLIELVKNKL